MDELAGLATAQREERCKCLAQIQDIMRQSAAAAGQLPADLDPMLATQGLQRDDGRDHARMGAQEPIPAYDLATAAPALIDSFLAGLATRPPRRAARTMPRVRAKTTIA